MTITNHDLHIMLIRMEGRQIADSEKMDDIIIRQKEHEDKDEVRFNNLNKYAASVAILSSAVGASFMYAWNWLTGKA